MIANHDPWQHRRAMMDGIDDIELRHGARRAEANRRAEPVIRCIEDAIRDHRRRTGDLDRYTWPRRTQPTATPPCWTSGMSRGRPCWLLTPTLIQRWRKVPLERWPQQSFRAPRRRLVAAHVT
jgi:hypothetical protein